MAGPSPRDALQLEAPSDGALLGEESGDEVPAEQPKDVVSDESDDDSDDDDDSGDDSGDSASQAGNKRAGSPGMSPLAKRRSPDPHRSVGPASSSVVLAPPPTPVATASGAAPFVSITLNGQTFDISQPPEFHGQAVTGAHIKWSFQAVQTNILLSQTLYMQQHQFTTELASLRSELETTKSQLDTERSNRVSLQADVKSLNERAHQATPARGNAALSRRMREIEQSIAVEAAASVATPVYEWTTNEALFTPPTDTQISGMMTRLRELCATEEGRNAVVKIMRFKTADADAFKEGRNAVDLHAGDTDPQVLWQLYAYAVQRRALSACVRRVASDDAGAIANYPKGLKPWVGTQPIYFDTARSAPMDQAELRERQRAILEQQQQQLNMQAMAALPPMHPLAPAKASASQQVPEPTMPSAAEVADKGEMSFEHRAKLSSSIARLASKYVPDVASVVREESWDCDDESEVDIDLNKLSSSTLWRISDFVDAVDRHKAATKASKPSGKSPKGAQRPPSVAPMAVDSPAVGSTAMTPLFGASCTLQSPALGVSSASASTSIVTAPSPQALSLRDSTAPKHAHFQEQCRQFSDKFKRDPRSDFMAAAVEWHQEYANRKPLIDAHTEFEQSEIAAGRVPPERPERAQPPEWDPLGKIAPHPPVEDEAATECFKCKDGGILMSFACCGRKGHMECVDAQRAPPGGDKAYYCDGDDCPASYWRKLIGFQPRFVPHETWECVVCHEPRNVGLRAEFVSDTCKCAKHLSTCVLCAHGLMEHREVSESIKCPSCRGCCTALVRPNETLVINDIEFIERQPEQHQQHLSSRHRTRQGLPVREANSELLRMEAEAMRAATVASVNATIVQQGIAGPAAAVMQWSAAGIDEQQMLLPENGGLPDEEEQAAALAKANASVDNKGARLVARNARKEATPPPAPPPVSMGPPPPALIDPSPGARKPSGGKAVARPAGRSPGTGPTGSAARASPAPRPSGYNRSLKADVSDSDDDDDWEKQSKHMSRRRE